jgi:hypothetical protein
MLLLLLPPPLLLLLQANAYAFNDAFAAVLQQRMNYFSNDPSADVLNRVRGEITQAGAVCVCGGCWDGASAADSDCRVWGPAHGCHLCMVLCS